MQATESAEIVGLLCGWRGNVPVREDVWWRSWSREFLLVHELGG
ncbi:hypothetical protein MKY82_15575 [Paenibacillus sp. FSL W7-1279]